MIEEDAECMARTRPGSEDEDWPRTMMVADGIYTAVLHMSEGAITRPHTLPMARMVVSLEGPIQLNLLPEARSRCERRGFADPQVEPLGSTACSLLTPPGLPCVIGTRGRALSMFLDPASPEAIGLLRLSERETRDLEGAAREVMSLERDGPAFTENLFRLARSRAPSIDARVRRALAWPLQHPNEPWSMPQLAAYVGLSVSRLNALVRTELGVSLRAIGLLRRTTVAFAHIASGASLTQAAHEAGFSDHAHLTRTCVRLFGQPPSVVRDSRIVQAGPDLPGLSERP